MHCHFIRERVQIGDVDLQHICTNLQTTNILTKALGADKFQQFMSNLGLTILDFPSLRGSTNRTLSVLAVSGDQADKGWSEWSGQKSLTGQVGKGGRTRAHNGREGVQPQGRRYAGLMMRESEGEEAVHA